MTGTPTRPTTDQFVYRSSRTGNHILDAYLESAEKGGRVLGDLLGDLFDEQTGNFNADLIQFRVVDGTFQSRVGTYTDPNTGWSNLTSILKPRGDFSTTQVYNTLDLVADGTDLYLCMNDDLQFNSVVEFRNSSDTFRAIEGNGASVSYRDDAIAARDAAEQHKLDAEGHMNTALGYKNNAESAKTAAESARDALTLDSGYQAVAADLATGGNNYIATAAGGIASINTVASNIANVNLAAALQPDVADVLALETKMDSVINNETAITNVGNNITPVSNVHNNMSAVTNLNNNLSQITTLNANWPLSIADVSDVTVTNPQEGELLVYSVAASGYVNGGSIGQDFKLFTYDLSRTVPNDDTVRIIMDEEDFPPRPYFWVGNQDYRDVEGRRLGIAPTWSGSATASVNTYTTYVATLAATPSSGGVSVSYSVSTANDSGFFQIRNGDELHFVAPPEFSTANDANGDNIYNVTVLATDQNNTAPFSIAVTVGTGAVAPTQSTVFRFELIGGGGGGGAQQGSPTARNGGGGAAGLAMKGTLNVNIGDEIILGGGQGGQQGLQVSNYGANGGGGGACSFIAKKTGGGSEITMIAVAGAGAGGGSGAGSNSTSSHAGAGGLPGKPDDQTEATPGIPAHYSTTEWAYGGGAATQTAHGNGPNFATPGYFVSTTQGVLGTGGHGGGRTSTETGLGGAGGSGFYVSSMNLDLGGGGGNGAGASGSVTSRGRGGGGAGGFFGGGGGCTDISSTTVGGSGGGGGSSYVNSTLTSDVDSYVSTPHTGAGQVAPIPSNFGLYHAEYRFGYGSRDNDASDTTNLDQDMPGNGYAALMADDTVLAFSTGANFATELSLTSLPAKPSSFPFAMTSDQTVTLASTTSVIRLADNGSKIGVLDGTTLGIYSMSSAYDLNTMSSTATYSAGISNLSDWWFSSEGLEFWTLASGVFQHFTLSEPFNPATRTSSGRQFSTTSTVTSASRFRFSDNGLILQVKANAQDGHQYSLSSPYAIDTATSIGSHTLFNNLTDFVFDTRGMTVYQCGSGNSSLLRSDLDRGFYLDPTQTTTLASQTIGSSDSIDADPTGVYFFALNIGGGLKRFPRTPATGQIDMTNWTRTAAFDLGGTNNGLVASIVDLCLAMNGTKLYIHGTHQADSPSKGTYWMFEYTLSTAYDVSTATFENRFDYTVPLVAAGRTSTGVEEGMFVKPDGSKLYVATYNENNARRMCVYSLTNGDLSTATYDGFAAVSNFAGSTSTGAQGFSFSDDGSHYFHTNGGTGYYSKTLAAPWDVDQSPTSNGSMSAITSQGFATSYSNVTQTWQTPRLLTMTNNGGYFHNRMFNVDYRLYSAGVNGFDALEGRIEDEDAWLNMVAHIDGSRAIGIADNSPLGNNFQTIITIEPT